MGKVFGIHEFELRPDASAAEFERVLAETPAMQNFPGVHWSIAKGNRGARDGKYVLIWEIDSLATRDQWMPQPDVSSDEGKAFFAEHPDTSAAYAKIGAFMADEEVYTDYEVVGGS